jgi:hypothetical protein
MKLDTEPYLAQAARWPEAGRHILAQFDAASVIVYQAYGPDIGAFASEHGYFGGPFSLHRMSWIKPNFLWMMYRSGWGTKPGQEITLAIRLRREAFESILRQAVYTTFVAERYASYAAWQKALAESPVRLQWDPDHDPAGHPLPRRAVQLGLSGSVLEDYARKWILEIQDISEFANAQRPHVAAGWRELVTPRETIYTPSDVALVAHLGLANSDTNAGNTP